METLDRLLEHDRWGTTTLLEASRDLTDVQLDRELDIGHRTIRATFTHTIGVIEHWLALMRGEEPDLSLADTSVASLIAWHENAYARFAEFARDIRDSDRLERTFDLDGYPMTFGGAILHVILHNAEHRTEIVHIMRRAGVAEPPEVDHGLWDFVRRGLDE